MLDEWCGGLDGLQDTDCAVNGWVKEVLLSVLNIEVKLPQVSAKELCGLEITTGTGDAVCRTASNGGLETTALSKAPGWAMSSTMAKSSLSVLTFGWAFLILSAFS